MDGIKYYGLRLFFDTLHDVKIILNGLELPEQKNRMING